MVPFPEAKMTKVQSKDYDKHSGGGGRSGGDDLGSHNNFLRYLLGASPLPPTTSGSSSAPPVFLPANVARVGNDDATTPPSDVEPIQPSAPPLSELDAEESTNPYSMPSVVFATPFPPPFAPHNQAMASTMTAAYDLRRRLRDAHPASLCAP